MVQRDKVPEDVMDRELWLLITEAINAASPTYGETPYGATKTAELDVQFSIDSSYGLTKERYGWFSDGVLFDESNFDETTPRLTMSTNAADGTSSTRLRSAYPGQYIGHTISEPGVGVEIAAENIERDEDNLVSLSHGEISLEVSSIDNDDNVGINAHGISYEDDAVYHQVRVDKTDVLKVPQSEWNLDPMDGTGPSGRVLEPEGGYVYQFIYSWYGEGPLILAVQDPSVGELIPVNAYVPDTNDKPTLSSPNLPVNILLENQGTAEELSLVVGGMVYATHGKGNETITTRETEEARHPPSGFIGENVVLDEEAVDPYATTLSPLIAAKRNQELEVQEGLRFEVNDVLVNASADIYVFTFDEFDEAAANLDGTFNPPQSRNTATDNESNILTNTTATTYAPSTESVLRGMVFIPSSKDSPALVTGQDATSRIPLRSTLVVAAALSQGASKTTADPARVSFLEGY